MSTAAGTGRSGQAEPALAKGTAAAHTTGIERGTGRTAHSAVVWGGGGVYSPISSSG